jgi:choline transport protein
VLIISSFNLLTLVSLGFVVGSVWPALGSSIIIALFNGGSPGVLYEFTVVSIFYFIIAASIAELASAIPSSSGVYHWASVTPGPKYGRIVGFFAGCWNCLAWIVGAGSMSAIAGKNDRDIRSRASLLKYSAL